MNKLMLLMCTGLITLQSHSAGMYEQSKKLGVNSHCLSDLKGLTDYLKPVGANLNFVHPSNPGKHTSSHISLQKGIDGSTAYIVSLNPKSNGCSYSYSKVVTFNTSNCNTIKEQLASNLGSNLKIMLDEKGYTIFNNSDNNVYILMTEPTPTTCTAIETQIVF